MELEAEYPKPKKIQKLFLKLKKKRYKSSNFHIFTLLEIDAIISAYPCSYLQISVVTRIQIKTFLNSTSYLNVMHRFFASNLNKYTF